MFVFSQGLETVRIMNSSAPAPNVFQMPLFVTGYQTVFLDGMNRIVRCQTAARRGGMLGTMIMAFITFVSRNLLLSHGRT